MESQQGQNENKFQGRESPDKKIRRYPTPDRWSDKEIAVLKQWQSDTLFWKCIPYSTFFVIMQEGLITRGRLQGIAKIPKFIRIPMSMFAGYILGRGSSVGELNRRLREECPDGVVAQFIREQQQQAKGLRGEVQSYDGQDSLPREERIGLPSQGDTPPSLSPDTQPTGPRLGYYDRLREQNKYSSGDGKLPPLQDKQPEEKEPVFFADKPQTPRQSRKKNKYGDDWEE